MRLHARAASLCAAAVLLALAPAAAQSFTTLEPAPGQTQHLRVWPGTLASGMDAVGTPAAMVPGIISPGLCDPGDGTTTFTFSYADQGVVLWADGRFEERGTFTVDRIGDEIRVIDLDSTFTGSSANGTIAGERHLRTDQISTGGPVSCAGTSDADRFMMLGIHRVETVHRLTPTNGDVVVERGSAYVGLSSWAEAHNGHYISLFEAEQGDGDADADGIFDLVDNCADVANPTQANLDGDALGDACDPDDDGDGVPDDADNCPAVANALQRDSDADGVGDLCDGTFDSNDGFAGGGGRLGTNVHLSVALHSKGDRLHGSGQVIDGSATVRLLDVSGLHSDGNRAVAVGQASIDGGAAVSYRLEIVDDANAFELEIGDRRWAGPLTNGDLVVK